MMTARRLICSALALGFTLSLSSGIAAARQATPPAPGPSATPPAKFDAPKPAPKQDDLTNPITGSKPRPPAPAPAATPAPEPAKPAGEPVKDPKAADAATQTITAGGLTFDIPKEWVVETPAKSMFTPVAQFRIPAGKSGATEDATVKVFTGIRGGVGPNIERWKAQIGSQDKPSEEKDVKVGNLPVHVLYTGKGTFSAGAMMGGAGEAKKNYMIAGAIVVLDDGDVQFKATGPGVLIDAQKPAWEAMIKSMRVAK
jgi:hypothetical protein